MSADFLPLEVGNRWVYDVLNEDGRKIGQIDFSVQEHTILSGRSFYVVSRFPFVSEGANLTKLIRYDRQERQFTRMIEDEEVALFTSDGASAEVVQADASGLPIKFVLKTDGMALTFQRGVGIVEGRVDGPNGTQIVKIASARVGERRAAEAAAAGVPETPQPRSPAARAKELVENVTNITEENPLLDVQAVPVPEGYKFILTVANTSDKLLPFQFSSSKRYDFVVTDPATGQEIWRWSRRMFFSQVVRSEALLPKRQWHFEAVWNRRDNELNVVPVGRYQVVGLVATQPPIESDPLTFEVQ